MNLLRGRMLWNRRLQVMAILAVIALGATVASLSLQTYFGRLPLLILFGQILAATGAAAFALWVEKRQ